MKWVLLAYVCAVSAFSPHHSKLVKGCSRTSVASKATKGFGKKPEPVKKEVKTAGKKTRDSASETYESNVQLGIPEYDVLARPFGAGDDAWRKAGSVTCGRDDKPTNVIYRNEDALKQGLFRLFPKMKPEEKNLEYGFRLTKFPDEEIRLAVKETGDSSNPFTKWVGGLTNPMNTDDYTK